MMIGSLAPSRGVSHVSNGVRGRSEALGTGSLSSMMMATASGIDSSVCLRANQQA